MPQYFTPGVYIEEIERGPRPIEGVPTSVAAFLGETERGPVRPQLVTSPLEYRRWFGGNFGSGQYLPSAVAGFFQNKGSLLYVARIVGDGATPASINAGDFTVEAIGPGSWGLRVWYKIEPGTTKDSSGASIGFRLKLAYFSRLPDAAFDPFQDLRRTPRPAHTEVYDDLSVDPNAPNYFAKRLVNQATNGPVSALAQLRRNPDADLDSRPEEGEGFLDTDGEDGATPVTSADFVGEPLPTRPMQGLTCLGLDPFRDVALVYAPFPAGSQTDIAKKVIEHCENSAFRFAVVDPDPSSSPNDITPRDMFADSQYAALYAPWIWVSDAETGQRVAVPPGGHVLGVYARTDAERGVFKSPANEILQGAVGLTFDVNDASQERMNPAGVNAIRTLPGRGIRIWGARTMSSNTLWKYVSVRRLFIFLERSIYENTQWVVFEPNNEALWARVKDTISIFLTAQWRTGALLGATAEEAFFVTCDRTTMTQDDILNGRLVCEIGIAPTRPAEFVIFRIFQNTAEAKE